MEPSSRVYFTFLGSGASLNLPELQSCGCTCGAIMTRRSAWCCCCGCLTVPPTVCAGICEAGCLAGTGSRCLTADGSSAAESLRLISPLMSYMRRLFLHPSFDFTTKVSLDGTAWLRVAWMSLLKVVLSFSWIIFLAPAPSGHLAWIFYFRFTEIVTLR